MVGFGGGGGSGTSSLQWLVWIQLVVMILLIFLLYCFSLYATEIGDGEVRVSLSSRINNPSVDRESTTSFFQSPFKVVGSSSIRGEISTTDVSRRLVRSQNGTEGDTTSAKDVTSNHSFTETHSHHPCWFFKLAGEAFLKCLGLDCMAEDSRSRKQSKTD